MGKGQRVVHLGQRVVAWLAVVLLTWASVGCAKPTEPTVLISEPTQAPNRLVGEISEVSPPETLELLKQIIDAYTPQVRILSPRPGEVVDSTRVSMRVQVRGLPLFKDETWQLGPHLHVFLDDQPYRAVYDLSEPIIFEDLSPGTHTIRVFASRPWHESFKNQGAFDQRTFHIVAPTPQNEINASAPLLTYSRPQGTYGAEPIMLDFYLTNAPLHLNAQEDAKDDLHDWRIRCTVNGQSFVFDQWQPIYLKGFQPGQNWVQLELIDENGQPIDNRFNNTVRIIDYQPGGQDTLSRLVRGELDLREVASIIDPTYQPPQKPIPTPPEPAAETTPEPVQTTEPTENLPPRSESTVVDTPKTEAPDPESLEPVPDSESLDAEEPLDTPITPQPLSPAPPAVIAPAKPSPGKTTAPPASQPLPSEKPAAETAEDGQAALEQPAVSDVEAKPSAEFAPSTVETDVAPDLDLKSEAEDRPNPFLLPDKPATPAEKLLDAAKQKLEASDELDFSDAIAPVELNLDTPEAESPSPKQFSEPSGRSEESTANSVEESPKASSSIQGLRNRFKGWKQKAVELNPFAEDEAPGPELNPIPTYRAPSANEPPSSTPPKPDPTQPQDDAEANTPRVMPELANPYLTQPYLTEPRLEGADPEENVTENNQADDEPTPDKSDTPERPSPRTGLKRPYI